MTDEATSIGPLAGLRAVELGSTVAGPFCARLLADFGADVIKVEQPEGDAVRSMGRRRDGHSLYGASILRAKRLACIDLRCDQGRALARRLCERADIVVENFRPGTLEGWGLGYDALSEVNPGLVLVRISGFGQQGPYSQRGGYGVVCEAVSGLRGITGDPDRPPPRMATSLTDYIAGLYAAFGAVMAILHRGRTGKGQVVDVAIYEAVFNMMESALPELDLLGEVRERQGSKLSGIVPSNTYQCRDGKYIIIGGNGDSIFKRLMRAAGREDLASDPRLEQNDGRVQHEEEIDRAISEWASQHTFSEALATLEEARVPAGPIYSMEDIVEDEHFKARDMFATATLADGTEVKLPNMVPKLTESPGGTSWVGPELGAHNEEVYQGMLGMSAEEIEGLRRDGVV